MIYLDNAGTTQVSDEVVAEMLPYFKEAYGNPGSVHKMGIEARKAVDTARERVASLINAEPDEIIFTSGGSEANNLMIRSANEWLKEIKYPFCTDTVSSLTEHDSMKRALENYNDNSNVEFLNYLPPEELLEHIRHREYSDIFSFMYVNNELGFVNPVYEIGKLAEEIGFYFFTDCVQALGNEYIDVKKMNCAMASFSSHKIHGPKGVGALYVKREVQEMLCPIIYGGSSQEFGFRGGTENVPGIVGFGKACELQDVDRNKTAILSLRKAFLESLKHEFLGKNVDFRINFDRDDSKIISLTFKNVDAETLVLMLSSRGVYISAGSACKSLEQKPNEVLLAAGFAENEARSTVRVSLSCYNKLENIKEAAKIICDSVSILMKCI